MHAGAEQLLLSISSEMSELLNCTDASFRHITAATGIGYWPRSRLVLELVQKCQNYSNKKIRCSHYSGVRGAAGGTWYSPTVLLMVLNSLVATLVVLSIGRNLFLYRFRLWHQHIWAPLKIVPLGPQDPKYPFPTFGTFPYRRRYWKHMNCKDTTYSIVGPQLRLVLGVGGLVH